jgi:hypothetical protein
MKTYDSMSYSQADKNMLTYIKYIICEGVY